MPNALLWHPDWWHAAAPATHTAWRGVEAQHIVATLKLVDSLEEQDLLEQLLEASKPPTPREAPPEQHYLLTTPFRYRSPHPSRFRKPHEAGLWYGAVELSTACTEVAYWRWRFLMDSDGLRDRELVTEHTFFQATIEARRLIDLTSPPWSAHADTWRLSRDYGACHQLAGAAREQGVDALLYASARVPDPPGGRCLAVFTPQVLSLPQPVPQQTWVCKVTRQRALLVHERERATLTFEEI
jgi:hypothetical protein